MMPVSQTIPVENLTEKVRAVHSQGQGKEQAAIDHSPFDDEPVYQQFFEQLARGLHGGLSRNVLLTGERGVGQLTLLTEFTQQIVRGDYGFLQDCDVIKIDCRYLAPDESRSALAAIFSDLADNNRIIVCIDGFISLLREHTDSDNRPRLLAALSRASCRVIGLVTPRECEEYFASDPNTMDFFSIVPIYEPSNSVAIKLLQHFSAGLEQNYEVRIKEDAIEKAVVLSSNYILSERLPYKALRLLQQECEDIQFERSQHNAQRYEITAKDIERRVSVISGVPEHTLRGMADQTDYRACLSEEIFGQQHAVKEVATELGLIKAELRDPQKPASVMLFVGPTGVGKTEMAKALARFYSSSKRLKTFTLGNFVEPHSVSGVIGVPPGYVGHDQGGRLINELISDPHSVFLLDEADKAHPDVLQPFLNLFDEGWIYDQRGVKAYADRAVFVLTTNVGQRQILEMTRNGEGIEAIIQKTRETLSQIRHSKLNRPVFTEEFLARIKRVVVFGSLDLEAMTGITNKLVKNISEEWQERRNKTIALTPELIQWIADEAYQRNEAAKGREGGRIVRKLLSDKVEAAIEQKIGLHPQDYQQCSTVSVDENFNVVFD